VVTEVEKHYKKCDMIPNKKRDKYQSYCAKTEKIEYEKELIQLQVELLKLQRYIKENNQKLLIIFE
jgi:polyphosphate kinase